MQIGNLPVCTIDVFGNHANGFYAGTLHEVASNSIFQEFHQNSFFMVLIIEQAAGTLVVDNETNAAGSLQIAVIKPNSINKLHFNAGYKGKVICFTEEFFSLRYNDNMLNQFSVLETSGRSVFLLSEENFCSVQNILAFTQSEFSAQKTDAQKALRSYLNIFLIELERNYNPLKISKYPGFSKEKAHKFQNLVKVGYKQFKLPSYYANQLNITTNYLNKISKQYFGVSSGLLIRNHLILESKRILHYTNLSIGEVAFELGFEHVSYFVSFFKKQTGKTPEQFRKNK